MIVSKEIWLENQTVAEVNLHAFRKNIKQIKSLVGNRILLAVIKTNAYGHGIEKIALEAVKAAVERLGVTTVNEGIALRKQGINIPIQILSSVPDDQADLLVYYDLIASVSTPSLAIAINSAARRQNKTATVHAKLNTGLNRFGMELGDAHSFFQTYYDLPNVYWEGIYTHFSHADEGDWKRTEGQYKLFMETVNKLEVYGYSFPIKHVGASTITLERPDMYLDMVRPGIALFGYTPDERQQNILSLEQVMTLKTKLLHVRKIPPKSVIGYGGEYVTLSEERIGILPIGHGDGYKRGLSNKGEVLIRGKRVKVVGTISLDQTFVNVTNIPDAKSGDEVILIGGRGKDRITARHLADWLGSNVDEILASLMHRIPRKYVTY